MAPYLLRAAATGRQPICHSFCWMQSGRPPPGHPGYQHDAEQQEGSVIR